MDELFERFGLGFGSWAGNHWGKGCVMGCLGDDEFGLRCGIRFVLSYMICSWEKLVSFLLVEALKI